MKDLVTIFFNAYYSEKSLIKIIKQLNNFKIIVIENSLQIGIKKRLEKKFKNTEVIIPNKNLGIAKACNLVAKKITTKYVFLNNPDINITPASINRLLSFAKKNKKFGIIAPTYKNEKKFKNYSSFEKKISKNISSVKWIDFNYLVKKSLLTQFLFDENFFLYFENIDFCLRLSRANKKLYVLKNVKFNHLGSKSVDIKYKNIVKSMRAWHYNWSKFYYYKKNFNYIYAITKILPNFYQSIKNLIINIFNLDFFSSKLNLIEIYGIISAILFLKSFYRAKK